MSPIHLIMMALLVGVYVVVNIHLDQQHTIYQNRQRAYNGYEMYDQTEEKEQKKNDCPQFKQEKFM